MKNTKKILVVALIVAMASIAGGYSATAQTLSLTCMPGTQSVGLNQAANFAVSGGSGSYTWSGSGISTVTTASPAFSASFGTAGTQTVTVASGGQTATCNVSVANSTSLSAVQCNAPSVVRAGETSTFIATGGNGSYSWSATNANISNPLGTVFQLTYPAAGQQTVTVASNGQTSNCVVNVLPAVSGGPLACTPLSQSVSVGQTATLSASGGTGTYSWFGAGLNITNPIAPAFNVTYNTPGTYTITVTSGSETRNCSVTVNAAPVIPGLPNTGFNPGS